MGLDTSVSFAAGSGRVESDAFGSQPQGFRGLPPRFEALHTGHIREFPILTISTVSPVVVAMSATSDHGRDQKVVIGGLLLLDQDLRTYNQCRIIDDDMGSYVACAA